MKKLIPYLITLLLGSGVIAEAQPVKSVTGMMTFKNAGVVSNTLPVPPTTNPTSPTLTAQSDSVIALIDWGVPATGTSVRYQYLKYGKTFGVAHTSDDGNAADFQIRNAIFVGGTAPADGVTYPNRVIDDGTGRKIPWHNTWALNWNNGQLTNAASVQGHLNVFNAGNTDLSNHSLTHVGYYDRWFDLWMNEYLMWATYGVRTRTMTIPTSYEGFVELSLYMKYLASLSQGYGQSGLSSDGNNNYPSNVLWGELLRSNYVGKWILTRRYMLDNWTDADLINQKTWLDNAMTASNGSSPETSEIWWTFSHGPKYTAVTDTNQRNNYNRFWNYLQNKPDFNRVWVAGVQEAMEYLEVKKTVPLTQTISGNIQRVKLNYANVDPNMRWRDASLLVTGTGKPVSVTVLGADSYSYNTNTGLINIYKKKTSGFTDPSLDPVLPKILSVGANSNDLYTINVTTSTPITTTVTSAWKVFDSPYTAANRNPPNLGTPLSVTAMTGSGTKWQLKLSSPISASTVLDYRIQDGNAVDASTGRKLTPYIGFPVNINPGAAATTGQKTLIVHVYAYSPATITINTPTGIITRNLTGTPPGSAEFVFTTGILINSITVTTTSGKVITRTPYGATSNTAGPYPLNDDTYEPFYEKM